MKNESVGFSAARMIELGRQESLALLAGVSLGRVGFTRQALPVIHPVNHLVDGDTIVVCAPTGSALPQHTAVAEIVVCEANHFDPHTRTGWSVQVTGPAAPVTAPLEAARYRRLLTPWIEREMDQIIRIAAEIVTGYRLAR